MWIDDKILSMCSHQVALAAWVPETSMVVLGASNQAEIEANVHACESDGVPILKRYGGGGTVVLHSGCAVVSLGCWVAQPFQNRFYFDKVNQAVIAALALRWQELRELSQDGLSDLTYRQAKVAGTSLFRSRNYLLYQASILVAAEIELIERYLCHPSREPEYRKGRTHRTFLRGLNTIVGALSPSEVAKQLEAHLPSTLSALLGEDLIASKPEQWDGLRRRAGL